MNSDEITALLRELRGKHTASEMVRILEGAIGRKLTHFSAFLWFTRAFHEIGIDHLQDLGAWAEQGDSYMSAEDINALLRPWLDREVTR